MTLQGADELRGRLLAIRGTFAATSAAWTADAVRLMQQRIHSPTGRMRRSIHGRGVEGFDVRNAYSKKTGTRGIRAGVWADYRVTFIDKGTKAHDVPKGGGPNRKVLTRGYPKGGREMGRNVFGKSAHVRGSRKRPFIRRSARDAFKANPPVQELIKLWNVGGGKSSRYVLGAKAQARRRAQSRSG